MFLGPAQRCWCFVTMWIASDKACGAWEPFMAELLRSPSAKTTTSANCLAAAGSTLMAPERCIIAATVLFEQWVQRGDLRLWGVTNANRRAGGSFLVAELFSAPSCGRVGGAMVPPLSTAARVCSTGFGAVAKQ